MYFRSLLALCASVLFSHAATAAPTQLLRFPDVCTNHVAFVYAGDIHVVGRAGGQARRLTSHAGLELFPKFSPDCRWIAFSAE